MPLQLLTGEKSRAFSVVLQEAVCLGLSLSCGRALRDTSAWKELHITKGKRNLDGTWPQGRSRERGNCSCALGSPFTGHEVRLDRK